MNIADVYQRYQELQAWVGWSGESAQRVAATAALLEPHLVDLVDDFYEEIDRHPNARKVITGGQAQINRLKGTLVQWLRELLAGRYDQQYVGPAGRSAGDMSRSAWNRSTPMSLCRGCGWD